MSSYQRTRSGASQGASLTKVRVTVAATIAGVLVAAGIGVASASSYGGTAASPSTVDCPDIAAALAGVEVPAAAKAVVDGNLALLPTQISQADAQLAETAGDENPDQAGDAVLGSLKQQRMATVDQIALAIGQGQRPAGLDALAACSLKQGDAAEAAAATDAATTDAATDAAATTDAAVTDTDTATDTAAAGATVADVAYVACPDVS